MQNIGIDHSLLPLLVAVTVAQSESIQMYVKFKTYNDPHAPPQSPHLATSSLIKLYTGDTSLYSHDTS